MPVRRSNAIWTSGFVTVCVITHLLSRLLISFGIIQYFEEGGRERARVSKGDREGEARWVGGLCEGFRAPEWLRGSGEGPTREQRALGRPGGKYRAEHRERSDGSAEHQPAAVLPLLLLLLVVEVVSGV